MSAGDVKNSGSLGNNFNFQLKSLQGLAAIAAGVSPPGGLATEATALSILAAVQNGTEFEQLLVLDLGGVGCPAACPTYIQIRIWDPQTQTFGPPIYYNAAGAVVVPVGPLQLVNPQYVLDSMLVQLTAINADLDVALSTRNAEVTQLLINGHLLSIDGKLNPLGQKNMAGSVPVVLASDQSAIPVTLPAAVSLTPSLVLVPANTALTNTVAGKKQVSLRVTAGGNAQIGGVAVPNGFTVTYSADNNDTVGSISYSTGAGSTILISYLT